MRALTIMKTYRIAKRNLFKSIKTVYNKRIPSRMEVANWQLKVMVPGAEPCGLLLTGGRRGYKQWAGENNISVLSWIYQRCISLAGPSWFRLVVQPHVSCPSLLHVHICNKCFSTHNSLAFLHLYYQV